MMRLHPGSYVSRSVPVVRVVGALGCALVWVPHQVRVSDPSEFALADRFCGTVGEWAGGGSTVGCLTVGFTGVGPRND